MKGGRKRKVTGLVAAFAAFYNCYRYTSKDIFNVDETVII